MSIVSTSDDVTSISGVKYLVQARALVEKEFELESISDLVSALTKATQLGEMFQKIEKIEKNSSNLVGVDLENFEKKENFLKSLELISNYESESLINQD